MCSKSGYCTCGQDSSLKTIVLWRSPKKQERRAVKTPVLYGEVRWSKNARNGKVVRMAGARWATRLNVRHRPPRLHCAARMVGLASTHVQPAGGQASS